MLQGGSQVDIMLLKVGLFFWFIVLLQKIWLRRLIKEKRRADRDEMRSRVRCHDCDTRKKPCGRCGGYL